MSGHYVPTKADWHLSRYVYIATNKDGKVWGYYRKPQRIDDEWFSGMAALITTIDDATTWASSLYKREFEGTVRIIEGG